MPSVSLEKGRTDALSNVMHSHVKGQTKKESETSPEKLTCGSLPFVHELFESDDKEYAFEGRIGSLHCSTEVCRLERIEIATDFRAGDSDTNECAGDKGGEG